MQIDGIQKILVGIQTDSMEQLIRLEIDQIDHLPFANGNGQCENFIRI